VSSVLPGKAQAFYSSVAWCYFRLDTCEIDRTRPTRQSFADLMKKQAKKSRPLTIRLPGFQVEGEVGLGDVIKRATSAFGFAPCAGCERRARRLNNLVVFSGRHGLHFRSTDQFPPDA
jgi:hypothetical protein